MLCCHSLRTIALPSELGCSLSRFVSSARFLCSSSVPWFFGTLWNTFWDRGAPSLFLPFFLFFVRSFVLAFRRPSLEIAAHPSILTLGLSSQSANTHANDKTNTSFQFCTCSTKEILTKVEKKKVCWKRQYLISGRVFAVERSSCQGSHIELLRPYSMWFVVCFCEENKSFFWRQKKVCGLVLFKVWWYGMAIGLNLFHSVSATLKSYFGDLCKVLKALWNPSPWKR